MISELKIHDAITLKNLCNELVVKIINTEFEKGVKVYNVLFHVLIYFDIFVLECLYILSGIKVKTHFVLMVMTDEFSFWYQHYFCKNKICHAILLEYFILLS
ncbi:hypothetical protein QTP88_022488 [Uroleucon formosanum]